MKVGLIYTSTTPELIADVEREVKKQLGEDVEMFSLQDPSILADVRAAGYVTAAPAARLIGMYMKAVEEGVDAMLNLCSSVGEVADCAQDAAKYLGVPIVRVDEEMCREAVRLGKRVGVMATLPTTLTPTKNTVARV
ncbi:MAG: Asp/Glu/hydantoin racemase, partial [Lachnospiraceae bacterium]|nr:Asp/Glu/hydantoin racemase [Lachnospiraceae bacterium]